MIELQYRAGLACPHWQSDVAAAAVRGGGPLRPGAELAQVRQPLGRRTCLPRIVEDRVTGTRPSLRETFPLRPGLVAGCCVVDCQVVLDGLRSHLLTSSAEDGLHEELGVPHDPLPGGVEVLALSALIEPQHARQRQRADQRVRQVLG
jgi:hypothetical protein